MDRFPVPLTPPAAPSLRAYVALAALAGPFLLCVGTRRRGPLVDLHIAPGAADLFASLAAIGATLTAALVLWWHLRPRRSGQPRPGALRNVGASGLSAALVWALLQVSVPAFLALPGLPGMTMTATVRTDPLPPGRACPHPFALADPPANLLSVRTICAASMAEAKRIAASGTPTVRVVPTGWGNPMALIQPTATLAPRGKQGLTKS